MGLESWTGPLSPFHKVPQVNKNYFYFLLSETERFLGEYLFYMMSHTSTQLSRITHLCAATTHSPPASRSKSKILGYITNVRILGYTPQWKQKVWKGRLGGCSYKRLLHLGRSQWKSTSGKWFSALEPVLRGSVMTATETHCSPLLSNGLFHSPCHVNGLHLFLVCQCI